MKWRHHSSIQPANDHLHSFHELTEQAALDISSDDKADLS
jgi:hypothetical protein